MNKLLLATMLVLAVAALGARAECVDGELKQTEVSEGEEKESKVSLFFKSVGCTLKKEAIDLKEGAKKLGGEIQKGAKKFGEGAKKFGSNVKSKFGEFKDKLATSEEETKPAEHSLLANVELINPDVLKAEQKCGHGYILDVLGDCKKL